MPSCPDRIRGAGATGCDAPPRRAADGRDVMIRAAVIALLLFTAALLQTALFPYLTLAGFRPDLLLLLTAAFALEDGPLTGTVVGFGAGLLADLMVAEQSLGLSAAVLTATGYAVGVARPFVAVGSVTAPVLVALGSGVLATGAYALLARLLGDPRFTPELVVEASLLVGLYNTLLAPLAFGAVRRLTGRFPPERAAPL